MYIYFGVWYGVVMCNMLISHVFFIWHLKSMLGRLNANQASFGIVLGACANGGSSFLRGRTVEVLEWWTDARAAVLESCVVLEWVPCGQDLVVAASALRQMQRQYLRTDWESTVLPCTSTAVFKFRSVLAWKALIFRTLSVQYLRCFEYICDHVAEGSHRNSTLSQWRPRRHH